MTDRAGISPSSSRDVGVERDVLVVEVVQGVHGGVVLVGAEREPVDDQVADEPQGVGRGDRPGDRRSSDSPNSSPVSRPRVNRYGFHPFGGDRQSSPSAVTPGTLAHAPTHASRCFLSRAFSRALSSFRRAAGSDSSSRASCTWMNSPRGSPCSSR